MITPENFADALRVMGFVKSGNSYEKDFPAFGTSLKADLKAQKLIYPDQIKGRDRNDFYDESHKENLVVFECVNRLLEKGYRPEHIELEKEWHLGHDAKSGRADICVTNADGKMLFIIECKTAGKEYKKAFDDTKSDGGQLFSYWQQEKSCEWLILYASDYENGNITYTTESVDCRDDKNIINSAKKDGTIKLYQNAHAVQELFDVWDETYEKRFCGDVVLREDTVAYKIGLKPLRKKDLKDFAENDKIVNRFEEILRHNNVSDKENAFNRLVALFICKLVDEIQKGEQDIVEFQYKVGTDTYESLQDRLQRLHRDGMEKFMREEIFYISDDYADTLVRQYTGQNRKKMIADLKQTLRILKFYTNNDFAFKDVHNEELFYQNGKILVEVVQLFENYRIIGASDLQTLGDLFEQLLNKGFKQNEGQFFTPVPITRFIWDSLPMDEIVRKTGDVEAPKLVDYACGAGHFLTQGFEAINDAMQRAGAEKSGDWVKEKLYGIEKDYRLARVSKISLFMHGAGGGNIIFGDGLENYRDKGVIPNAFDVLVANPPYAVYAFKQHLKLRDNDFAILSKISNDGSEIETLFVERIAQLVKPDGVAAVILPSSILNKENGSFIAARESLLTNFYIRAIAQFGSKTFGATGTNTIIVFLQKFDEPPKRIDLVTDSKDAIMENRPLADWEDKEIFEGYLAKIGVSEPDYREFLSRGRDYDEWNDVPYFAAYAAAFLASAEYTTKAKQRSFIAAAENEQRLWCNAHFYDFALTLESEKLTYFGLCHRQTTLIITTPDENKAQETFLGYTWSNRKGQEGIQIKAEGGLMYRPDDRTAEDTLAALVRASYGDEEVDMPALSAYYHYLPLADMLDFSGVTFNKAIKTTKARNTEIKEGMTAYKLNGAEFEVSIGDRVVSSEIEENGKYPVYSANVFEPFGYINKQNITDFSVPSILWGIDGDWMVNYMPENQPFYPTDHCGVLRVNTDKILPKYLAMALKVEGEYERFSRNNRASTQRIKNLTIQIPEKAVQKRIVQEIEKINKQIAEQDATVKKCDEDIKAKFVKMFGDKVHKYKYPFEPFENHVFCKGGDTFKEEFQGNINPQDIPFYKVSDMNTAGNEKIMNKANNYVAEKILIGKIKATIFEQGTIIFPKVGMALKTNKKRILGRRAAIDNNTMAIWGKTDKINIEYLYSFLDVCVDLSDIASNANPPSISATNFYKALIMLPPIDLQNQFATFVKQCDKTKADAQKLKEALLVKREQAIEKYFR